MADSTRLCGECGITEKQAKAFNRGRLVDWKVIIIPVLGWALTVGWYMIGQYHATDANTKFRHEMTPVIQSLQTRVEVTNEILCRIESQLRQMNANYLEDMKSNRDR